MLKMLKKFLRSFVGAFAAFGLLIFARAAAPTITSQPTNQTVAPGGNAFFSVTAVGTPPLRYGWRREGQFIPGATNSFLSLSNVQVADVGYYTVRVQNSNGFEISTPAALAVYDTYALNLPADFSLIANQLEGTNNNLNTVIPFAPDGTTLIKFDSDSQSFGAADTYFAGTGWFDQSFNPTTTTLGPGEGAFINLPVPSTLVFTGAFRPLQLPVLLETGFNLLSRQNPREARYEQIVGQPPSEGTVVDQFDPLLAEYRTHIFFQGQWRDGVPLAQVGEAIWISHLSFPVISEQPVSRTNEVIGSTVGFAVAAGLPFDSGLSLHYQWRRNGNSIPGATNAGYAIPNAQLADAGSYTVAVQPARLAPGGPNSNEENVLGALISLPALLKFDIPEFPFSDSFDSAPVVNTFSDALTDNNSEATVESGEPRHAGKPGGHSVWLSWIAPTNGIVTFVTVGSSFDTLLAAYSGTNVMGTEIASDDDSGPFLSSRITFNVVAGQRYNIAVDGFAGASGDFVLAWNLEQTTGRLPLITVQPQDQVVDQNSSAIFGVGVLDTNATFQWFQDGIPISNATQSNYFIASVQDFDAGVYRVRVSSGVRSVLSRGAQLQVRPIPTGGDVRRAKDATTDPLAEDKFQDVVTAATNSALDLRPAKARAKIGGVAHGFSGTQIFSTVGSTKEPDEPNHAGIVGGKSEWFSYQPTNSGTLKIDTDGSNFDTVLAVYIGPGDSFLTLTNVASDNNSGTNGKTSSVLFNAISNTIYYVAVDGVNNVSTGVAASGNVHLNYRLALPLTLTSFNYSSSDNNGRVIFKISGTPNLAASVEAATNLASPTWISLFTNTAANGIFNYTNTNALIATNRLYRVLNRM